VHAAVTKEMEEEEDRVIAQVIDGFPDVPLDEV